MTGFAFGVFVSAQESEIRLRMVKLRFVDRGNIGGATFVIRMAIPALIVFESPMETGLGLHVIPDFLMAVNA